MTDAKPKTIELTGDPDVDDMIVECLETFRTKGVEYAIGSKDRLHNFRTVGEHVGVPMQSTWAVYFYKHFSAVMSYVKTGKVLSEPIWGRIKDSIVYLFLFAKMVRELEGRPKSSEPDERLRCPRCRGSKAEPYGGDRCSLCAGTGLFEVGK